MITRRQTAIGLASAALGSAVVSSASVFSGSAAAEADLRVVVSSELALRPGRAGEDENYVRTDGDGRVEAIEIEKLNRRSISRFEDLVVVANEGEVPYDRLAFAFAATGDDSDGQSAAAAEALRVVSGEEPTETDDQGRTTLLAAPDETFRPGDAVSFGLVVNLIDDDAPGDLDALPDGASVRLEIAAVDEE
ncbi:hypothetical protein EXE53_11990 [Halorubrum sp. SD626R]|uniref:hypothetical protein n=1 Tax=Halorubrum sp. SD626R TaxID=1419722 RepID=UPI0010F9F322|nr:hypothetical protein [Halorubrum sp. SD626R]TKX80117.1 hypothetical protein EXE53_11990 [Halorubrum sp. SD626R]